MRDFRVGGNMRHVVVLSLAVLALSSIAGGQSSNPSKKLPAILAHAQYVYVEPYSGTDDLAAVSDPRITPEDREAVANVQNGILKWEHFKLTNRRSEAELIIFVRKGRIASANAGVRVHVGSGPGPGSTTSRDPSQTDKTVGGIGGGEVGPDEDLFWVYSLDPDGKLTGPVWQKDQKEGLDAPDMPLFEKFKKDVTASIAAQAKSQASAKNSKP
jgi:hypothetical protein